MKVNTARLPGSDYTKNSLKYLQDSFREQVLVPTVTGIVEELKNNRKNDFIVETILMTGLVANLLFNIYLGVKLKLLMKT